ncbi:hypothetical protein ACHQM5_024285 [Ranunculus cassubicifolius]
MASLPDEIWLQILTLGTLNSKLTYKDLCCISISSKRLTKLSNENSLWHTLLLQDFPNSQSNLNQSSHNLKSLYKYKFEKERDKQLAAHRRAVFRIESQIFVGIARIKELKEQLNKENEKLKLGLEELRNLERIRSMNVALNVWQPEIVSGNQKRVVEQCVVPIKSRVSAVEMEVRVCKQQIQVLDNGYRDEKRRLSEAKKELELLKYHPLRDYTALAETSLVNPNKIQHKRKKLKQCSEM